MKLVPFIRRTEVPTTTRLFEEFFNDFPFFELKLEGNILTLKGERKMENEDEKGKYHRIESYYGSFTRSFRLPDTVDYEKINAEYKNGVLKVTIPQKPEVKPREIPVSVH